MDNASSRAAMEPFRLDASGSAAPAPLPGHAAASAAATLAKLVATCRATEWAGYDPYDALNSTLLKRLHVLDFKFPRLVITQLMKRSPVNFRPMLGVPKTQNPKGIALFLKAFLKLSKLGMLDEADLPDRLASRIAQMRAPGPYACWGYSFPWQTRRMLVPSGAPNLVCTTFVADALFDLFEHTHDERYLEMASSAATYIQRELYHASPDKRAYFSYPTPAASLAVHNANFLAAALLLRVWRNTGDDALAEAALPATRYSASQQHDDGSWWYGEGSTNQWVDNFHTGYNLCALKAIAKDTGSSEFDTTIAKGVAYYRAHFFTDDAAPKYFDVKTYPLDVHCVAQSVITLLDFREPANDFAELAQRVFDWSIRNMWDDRGYFYYQMHPRWKNRIPYMRWSQAWMTLAIATLLEASDGAASTPHPRVPAG